MSNCPLLPPRSPSTLSLLRHILAPPPPYPLGLFGFFFKCVYLWRLYFAKCTLSCNNRLLNNCVSVWFAARRPRIASVKCRPTKTVVPFVASTRQQIPVFGGEGLLKIHTDAPELLEDEELEKSFSTIRFFSSFHASFLRCNILWTILKYFKTRSGDVIALNGSRKVTGPSRKQLHLPSRLSKLIRSVFFFFF